MKAIKILIKTVVVLVVLVIAALLALLQIMTLALMDRVKKTDGVQLGLRLSGQFLDGTYSWGHVWPFDATKTNVWQRGRVMYRPTREIRADYVSLGVPANDTSEVEYGDTWMLVYRPETRPTLDAWPTDAAAFGKHACFYVRDVAKGGGFRPAEDGRDDRARRRALRAAARRSRRTYRAAWRHGALPPRGGSRCSRTSFPDTGSVPS